MLKIVFNGDWGLGPIPNPQIITVYDEIERTSNFWKIDQKYWVFVLFRHDYLKIIKYKIDILIKLIIKTYINYKTIYK